MSVLHAKIYLRHFVLHVESTVTVVLKLSLELYTILVMPAVKIVFQGYLKDGFHCVSAEYQPDYGLTKHINDWYEGFHTHALLSCCFFHITFV